RRRARERARSNRAPSARARYPSRNRHSVNVRACARARCDRLGMEGIEVNASEQTYETLGLAIGATFSTPFEGGCEVASVPDIDGNFDAYDSEGVLCAFSPAMVIPSSVRKGSKS